MNDTPTSGPMATSITHQARAATSSRASFSRSHEKPDLRERKKRVLERAGVRARRDVVEQALAAHAAAAQQHEAIAEACRVRDLVNGEKKRPAVARERSE